MDREVTPQKTRRGNAGGRAKAKGGGRGSAPTPRPAPMPTPTILRAAPPPAVATLFNPDQPRQQVHPQGHQKLYEPNSSPFSPPGPLSQPAQRPGVRAKADPVPQIHTAKTVLAAEQQNAPVSSRGWKLVNAQLQFCADLAQPASWAELTQYQVVGCIGLEGVGKSTLLSMLANQSPSTTNAWFPIQTLDCKLNGKHQTSGIDMCITDDNVVLLDCQPFLSSSMLHEMIQKHESPKFNALPLDQQLEVAALQLLVFLFSVCHHVLVVSDTPRDHDLAELLQCGEVLKQRVPSISGELTEHCAQAIFVQTKTPLRYADSALAWLQTTHGASLFASSTPSLPVFALPRLDAPSFPAAWDAFATFMQHLPKTSLTQKKGHTLLSLKEWVQNAARIYESLRKSSSMGDYSRLLQKASSSASGK
ncbi:hypothetical protein SPRG_03189 [Saprolegnia parasitica CBS 223.65]|uniref:Protein SMG9 n=1 Tax=Saprolegnia parasitica (strain CBS 223.65) TaxID=695850 RepID=A0A067CN76_SAPPC|nr:hypothetical protein SPRG_03189 [Saprolegnia parasitica CBS 223.65]KDO31973.1 hypothetical protein SPRG_03189 [Saprolegnia parasitica CBS 223.65]|eukprot:XP_012197169.1 hypothetical protein SPRG_03189 [Saprolegnia parasitica CBS 223.65]